MVTHLAIIKIRSPKHFRHASSTYNFTYSSSLLLPHNYILPRLLHNITSVSNIKLYFNLLCMLSLQGESCQIWRDLCS